MFVNLETRRSDWGKCNILVLTNFGELLGLLYIIRDGSGYVKIDRKKTLGDSVIELVDDPHYVFDVHAHQFIDGEEEGAPVVLKIDPPRVYDELVLLLKAKVPAVKECSVCVRLKVTAGWTDSDSDSDCGSRTLGARPPPSPVAT